jgi:hypothetical protein
MPPVSSERFGTLLRSLGSAERRAFVADLWSARGWETAIDGGVIDATRGGERQRIRVVDPGRFGAPNVGDADVLVTTRDRDAVREAAESAGARYVTPADLREQLLYGLDRETAGALFETTFGRPIDATGEPEPSGLQRARAVPGWIRSAVAGHGPGPRSLAVVLVALLLVGVAVGGPALSPRDASESTVLTQTFTPGDAGAVGAVTASPTPVTETPDDEANTRPAGLGVRSVTDLRALADGHTTAVIGTSRTLEVSARGPPDTALMRGRTAWKYTARIEQSHHYRVEGREAYPSSLFPPANESSADTVRIGIYAVGDRMYRQRQTPNDTEYERHLLEIAGDASGYATTVRGYLLTYLRGERTSVECAGTLTGGECFAYRIAVTGTPSTVPEGASDYRAVAVIQDNGLVSSLDVRYVLPDEDGDGSPERVRLQVQYDYSSVQVTPPEWLPEARNETVD